MLKTLVCSLIVVAIAFPVYGQTGSAGVEGLQELGAIRLKFHEVPHLSGTIREVKASLVEPKPATARSLHAKITKTNARLTRLSQSNVPGSLQSELTPALSALGPLVNQTPRTIADLSYFDVGGEKTVTIVRPALALASKRLDDIGTMVGEFGEMEVRLGRLWFPLKDLIDAMPADRSSSDTCIVQRVDQTSRSLASLLRDLDGALSGLRVGLTDSLVASGLPSVTADYEALAAMDASAEPLFAALGRVEGLLLGQVDFSFRYWGAAPEGRFGEIVFPLQIDSNVLLNGSGAVKSLIDAKIPAAVRPLAHSYGIDWVLEGIDQDLPAVLQGLRNDLSRMTNGRIDRLDELPSVSSHSSSLGTLAGFDFGKAIPQPDRNAPNYGVLKVTSQFDHREINKLVAALEVDALRAVCR
jgi:hypothetical protein